MPAVDVREGFRAGAAEFNAGRYWHAHEAWEGAWHALKRENRPDQADHLQGLILVAAALHNLREGKVDGFRRQMAEGLVRLRRHRGLGTVLGLDAEDAFREAMTDLYLDAARRLRLDSLDELETPVPPIRAAGDR